MKPGEIYWYDTGSDRRPIIVISRETLNRGNYVLIVPCTSSRYELRSRLPNCVPFLAGEFGFSMDCVAQCETIALVNHNDIEMDNGPIGTLDEERLRDIIRAIGYVIEAECEPV